MPLRRGPAASVIDVEANRIFQSRERAVVKTRGARKCPKNGAAELVFLHGMAEEICMAPKSSFSPGPS